MIMSADKSTVEKEATNKTKENAGDSKEVKGRKREIKRLPGMLGKAT